MKEVLVRTKPKYLQANCDYELAMVNLEMYYSFTNIRKDNNSFKWSVDGGKTWTILHIPTGCYEVKAINAEIIHIHGNTLQCLLISFDVPNSLMYSLSSRI